jgi:hypothetical protein
MSNVFKYEQGSKVLAFTTAKGHVSGTLMKNIDYRLPSDILSMKEWSANGVTVGDIFVTKYIVFVVLRKHFNTNISLEAVDKMLANLAPELQSYKLKTTNEDFPQLQDLLQKHIPSLEFCETSAWGMK